MYLPVFSSEHKFDSGTNESSDADQGVLLSFDGDCLDTAFVPCTGWPEPGEFLPYEVLKFLQIIADSRRIAGMETVECAPPYDAAEFTSLISTRNMKRAGLLRTGERPNQHYA